MDKPRRLASLGMSCQSAHQAARFADARRDVEFSKGPTDWLICPPARLAEWLDRGLDSPAPGEVVERGGRAWWTRGGFWFWHGYTLKRDGTRRLAIDETFERERDKLDHQRAVMGALDPATTLFVWSNVQNNLDAGRWPGGVYAPQDASLYRLDKQAAGMLEDALARFLGGQPRIEFVTRPDRAEPGFTLLEPGASEWKGEDRAWDALLEGALEGALTRTR